MRAHEAKAAEDRVWFYVPNDLHNRIRQAAAEQDRSVASWLRFVVKERLRKDQ